MNTSLIINFAASALTFIFGLLLILGILYPGRNDSMKLMFAIVLMVYGIYRLITSISKIKQAKLEERRLKLNEEKESFLKKL